MLWINYESTRLHAAPEPVMWQLDTRGEAEGKDRVTGKGHMPWSFDILHSESIWAYLPRPYYSRLRFLWGSTRNSKHLTQNINIYYFISYKIL